MKWEVKILKSLNFLFFFWLRPPVDLMNKASNAELRLLVNIPINSVSLQLCLFSSLLMVLNVHLILKLLVLFIKSNKTLFVFNCFQKTKSPLSLIKTFYGLAELRQEKTKMTWAKLLVLRGT